MKNFFGKVFGKKYPDRADEPQDILEEVYAGPPEDLDPDTVPEEIKLAPKEDPNRFSAVYYGPTMQPRAMLVYMGPPTRPNNGGFFFGNPWNCEKCGKENGPLIQSCGYCGAPKVSAAPVSEPDTESMKKQPHKFCPNCGAMNVGKFCRECGTDLSNVEPIQPEPEEINV
jgi:hypothetical protein